MAKYSFELKLEAVLAYLEGKESIREVAKRFNVSKTPLLTWIAHYRENGEQGLISSYTNYDIQFKMDVLNYISDFGASLAQAAAVFSIPAPSTIHHWQRQVERFGVLEEIQTSRTQTEPEPREGHQIKVAFSLPRDFQKVPGTLMY